MSVTHIVVGSKAVGVIALHMFARVICGPMRGECLLRYQSAVGSGSEWGTN